MKMNIGPRELQELQRMRNLVIALASETSLAGM
jgi:hypothetical protein